MKISHLYRNCFESKSLKPRVQLLIENNALSTAFSSSHVLSQVFFPPINRVELDLERIIRESDLSLPQAARVTNLRDVARGLLNINHFVNNDLKNRWRIDNITDNFIVGVSPTSQGCSKWAIFPESGSAIPIGSPKSEKKLALALLERGIIRVNLRIPKGAELNLDDIVLALSGESGHTILDEFSNSELCILGKTSIGIGINQAIAFKTKLGLIPAAHAVREIHDRLALMTPDSSAGDDLHLFGHLRDTYSKHCNDDPTLIAANIGRSFSLLKNHYENCVPGSEAAKSICNYFLLLSRPLLDSLKVDESNIDVLKELISYHLEKTHMALPETAKQSLIFLKDMFGLLIEEAYNNISAFEIVDVFGNTALDLLIGGAKSVPDNSIRSLSRLFHLVPRLNSFSKNPFDYQQIIIDSAFEFARRAAPELLSASGVIPALEFIWNNLLIQRKTAFENGTNECTYKTSAMMSDFKKKLSRLRNDIYNRSGSNQNGIILKVENLRYQVIYGLNANLEMMMKRSKHLSRG